MILKSCKHEAASVELIVNQVYMFSGEVAHIEQDIEVTWLLYPENISVQHPKATFCFRSGVPRKLFVQVNTSTGCCIATLFLSFRQIVLTHNHIKKMTLIVRDDVKENESKALLTFLYSSNSKLLEDHLLQLKTLVTRKKETVAKHLRNKWKEYDVDNTEQLVFDCERVHTSRNTPALTKIASITYSCDGKFSYLFTTAGIYRMLSKTQNKVSNKKRQKKKL